MTRIFRALTALVVVSTVLAAGVGTVAAANNSTSTATPTPTPTPEPEPQEVSIELSETTTITEWESVNGTWRITIRSKIPTRVTLVDAAALAEALTEGDGAASATVRTRSYNLGKGTTTITFAGSTFNGMGAVTLTSTHSNRLAVLRTEALAAGKPPVDRDAVRALLLVSVLGTAGAVFRWTKKRRDDVEKEAERLL